MDENARNLLSLAKEMAGQLNDAGLDSAAGILVRAIDEGCQYPELLVSAATYLLQGSRGTLFAVKKKAVSLVDRAVALAPEDVSILEMAVHCYELVLNDFPDRLNDIIRLSLRILDLDPDHVDAMITLAGHREHPRVKLSLEDAIRMLEWAQEVAPDNVYVAFSLTRLYMEARQYDEARKTYRRVVSGTGPGSARTPNTQFLSQSLHPKRPRKHRRYGKN